VADVFDIGLTAHTTSADDSESFDCDCCGRTFPPGGCSAYQEGEACVWLCHRCARRQVVPEDYLSRDLFNPLPARRSRRWG
jgi:hypothetical protein